MFCFPLLTSRRSLYQDRLETNTAKTHKESAVFAFLYKNSRTLPGFERSQCVEMAGVDSIEQPVRWRSSNDDDNSAPAAASSGGTPEQPGSGDGGGQELEAKMVSQSRGTVKLRVFLAGGAKLFAIYT